MRFEVETAIEQLVNKITIQDKVEEVSLLDSVGRVLGEDLYAPFSVPSYPKAAMDGYAVRYEDICGASKESPVSLTVIGTICAGTDPDFSYKPNTAVRIMTGAEVPQGYDAVIKQESTNYGEDSVEIYESVEQYENYCRIGEDLDSGDLVVAKYSRICPQHISVFASLGLNRIKVLKKMKVAILATGSELVEPGTKINKHRTFNSTSYQIQAVLESYNVEVVERACVKDEINDITDFLRKHTGNVDVIITTGGVSVGQKDLLPDAINEIRAETIFRGVNLKPGTPVTAAYLDSTVILCCSGNPFACIVNFQVFFFDMLAKKMNCKDYAPRQRYALVRYGFSRPRHLKGYVRAYYENGEVTIHMKGHDSSIMSSAMGSNCMVIQPEGKTIRVGDRVKIQFLNLGQNFY